MLSKSESINALKTYFRKHKVATIAQLITLLNTQSRMSVFRRLRDVGYLSSFTHSGKYYTLASVAAFDANGMWRFDGIGFSKDGNLKSVMMKFIENAQAGKTHKELEAQLNIRVHNSLLTLVRENKITRERVDNTYLYLSTNKHNAQTQTTRRRDISKGWAGNDVPDGLTIEILAAIVRMNTLAIDKQKILSALNAKAIIATETQITHVLTKCNLKKTLGSV